MADEAEKVIEAQRQSPTGKAVFALPPWAMWLLATIAASAGGCYTFMELTKGEEKLAMLVAIVACAALGITPGLRKAAPVLLLVCTLGLSSCSSVKGYLVSAQSLDEAGAQFEVAAPIFFRECAAQRLPIETCRGWRDFATRFKVLYRPSANAWHAASLVNEAAVTGRYDAMVGPLLAQLAEFGAVLTSSNLLPAGDP